MVSRLSHIIGHLVFIGDHALNVKIPGPGNKIQFVGIFRSKLIADEMPAYDGQSAVILNDNQPDFPDRDKTAHSWRGRSSVDCARWRTGAEWSSGNRGCCHSPRSSHPQVRGAPTAGGQRGPSDSVIIPAQLVERESSL